jgi:hypothetical protein
MPKKIIDQETAAAAIAALVDVLDGEDEHDIRANTGLSEERCKEIRALYCRLLKEFTPYG